MKVLLDECVPKRLRNKIPGHNIKTVQEAGWDGIKNGELLKKARENFEAFITVDRNLTFQQNLTNLPIPVIVIHARSNRLKDMEPFVAELLRLLESPLSLDTYHLEA